MISAVLATLALLLSFRTVSAVVALVLLAASAGAQPGHGDVLPPLDPKVYMVAPVSDAEVWREDLRALVHELERIHPDPYTQTPEAEFDRAVAALHDEIPRLAVHEVVVGFARLLALVGDGHTSLPLYFARGVDFHALPVRFGVYEDGIYIEGADEAYAEFVGGRVVSMGGVSGHEALRRVAPLISRDNDNWIAAVAPFYLNRIEVLHALGIAEDLRAVELAVEVDGHRRTAHVAALANPPEERYGLSFLPEYTESWVDARDSAKAPVPLYQRRFEDIYGWEYLPEPDVLYVKWDQVQNRAHGPTALEVVQEAMAFARERQPSKTVIDIRNNTGGEGTLARPVVREIVRTPGVDEPGALFVVIGRRTFSAAQMMTSWLEQFSSATFVGEPSSAFYNGYAGHDPSTPLPNSGIVFFSSNEYYQMGLTPRDARRQATPRLAAIPTFEDYRTNRDPALAAILEYEPDTFAHDVLAALASGDESRAEAVVRAYAARSVNRFAAAQSRVNALGYQLLREGETDRAISVFELNTRVHPHYANGYDSLGEGLAAAGEVEEAIAMYERALALDPDGPTGANARQQIDALRGDTSD